MRAASIGCTVEDIATLLGLSRKTIYNHMEQDPELAEAMDRGRGMGRASLRRMQWEKAEVGDTSMLIWLGKVLCGQRDSPVVAVTGANGGPVQSERVTVPVNDPIEAAPEDGLRVYGQSTRRSATSRTTGPNCSSRTLRRRTPTLL
jgi:predicted DNA-binding transcriptional regulator AlpA